MASTGNKTVFVTVGTTSFDSLISQIDSVDIKMCLKKMGFTKIICQIGQGSYQPTTDDKTLPIEYYRMKPTIKTDIEKSDLVICHAGAGSVLETLWAKKHCVVVINEKLMGNHQIELARKLSEDNYLFHSTCSTLRDTLETADFASLNQFAVGNAQLFVNFLNQIV